MCDSVGGHAGGVPHGRVQTQAGGLHLRRPRYLHIQAASQRRTLRHLPGWNDAAPGAASRDSGQARRFMGRDEGRRSFSVYHNKFPGRVPVGIPVGI